MFAHVNVCGTQPVMKELKECQYDCNGNCYFSWYLRGLSDHPHFFISTSSQTRQDATWVDLRWNEANEERWPTGQLFDVNNYDGDVVLPRADGYDCRFIHSQYYLAVGACGSIYGRLCEAAGECFHITA